MASDIHIFRSGPWQPLTRYFDDNFPPEGRWFRTPAHKLYYCHECRDRRQARSLEISVDYDRVRIRCKDGKHPGWV